MKTFITCYFLLLAFTIKAQAIHLEFEPKGKIVKFYFDSLTIYTDTASLFAVYAEEDDLKDYDVRVKKFVLKQVGAAASDTVTFTGDFIPFNDGVENKYETDWYVEWAIMHLLKKQKLKIMDKHGQLVKILITKKVGKKKHNYVKRSYINKATHEELLKEVLFIRIVDPVF